jgi:GAF domain-containing protein
MPFCDAGVSEIREDQRLAAIERYRPARLSGTPAFGLLLDAAREEFEVPMAALTIVGAERQTAVAARGFDGPVDSARADSFCRRPVADGRPLIVEDATRDAEFAFSPFVTGPFGLRFYAGAPVMLKDDLAMGAFCLIDRRPRRMGYGSLLRLLQYAAAAQELLASHVLSMDLIDQVAPAAFEAMRGGAPAFASA